MKIFKSLASGFCRTLKAWKGILLIWFGSLLMVSLVALPLKGFLKSALGGSMITERLKDGIDIEVLGDIGSGFRKPDVLLSGRIVPAYTDREYCWCFSYWRNF